MTMKIQATQREAVDLHRLVRRVSDKPKAIERNKGLFITCCLGDGMTLKEAYEAFEGAKRRLWANACA